MATAAVIVEIEVVGVHPDGRADWKALHGQPAHGSGVLGVVRPGDRLAAAVRPAGPTWKIVRLLGAPAGPLPTGGAAEAGALRVEPVRPGDVLLARFRFSGPDGSGRVSKQRPCLVMEVRAAEYRVRPIHGSNSAVRRTGTGRRIRNWAAAGLRKPSVVAALDCWIPSDGAGRPVGRIVGEDRRRLLAASESV